MDLDFYTRISAANKKVYIIVYSMDSRPLTRTYLNKHL